MFWEVEIGVKKDSYLILQDQLLIKKLKLRSSKSVRPWIHVLDCIHGYLYLACKMKSNVIKNGSSWNISNLNKNPYNTQSIIKLFQNHFNFKIIKEKIFREKF